MAGEKKYGLIIPSKKGAATKSKVTKSSIFGESSDEEDSGFSGSLWKENERQSKQIKSRESVTKALAEDPMIFEYDSLYDEMQEKKKKADPRLQKKDTKPTCKYIYQLKKMAEKRKLEQEIIYERKVQREMEEEGGEFKDKDAFLTSAYRKKLEERRKMEDELRREDTMEAANDVRKQKDLSKFHRNLLNQLKTVKVPTKENLEEKKRIVAAKRTNTEAMESAKERYLARKRAKLSVPVMVQDD